jgi:hypothetical protein
MSAMNRKMFANRDARNKLAGMGGILASSPELMGATQRFQDGGMTTPRGVSDSPRLSESMNVPIATLGGKSFFLSADNRSIVDGDGSVVRDPSVLRAIMQQTAPAPAPQSEEFVPPSMGASELNTPGIMQALNNAPQIPDERSALMAEAQSLIEANRSPESDALRARVDETVDPQGYIPPTMGASELNTPGMMQALDNAPQVDATVDPQGYIPPTMGASELNTPGIMQALDNAPRVDELVDPQGYMPPSMGASELNTPGIMQALDESSSAGFASELLRSAQETPRPVQEDSPVVAHPRSGNKPKLNPLMKGAPSSPPPTMGATPRGVPDSPRLSDSMSRLSQEAPIESDPPAEDGVTSSPRPRIRAEDVLNKIDPNDPPEKQSGDMARQIRASLTGKDEDLGPKESVKAYEKLFSEMLGMEDKDSEKEVWHNMAMIGFAIAAGESPNALSNIANGMLAGTKMMKDDRNSKQARQDKISMLALAESNEDRRLDARLSSAERLAGMRRTNSDNNTPERLRQQILKQVDDIETAELFGVMSEDGVTIDPVKLDAFIKQQQRIGLRLDLPDTGGEGTTVGQTTEYAQGTYRKISEGPDSDPTTWEKV